MPVYHFDIETEAGFGVSGLLEADDEARARERAKRMCGTCVLLKLDCLELDALGGLAELPLPDATEDSLPQGWRARAGRAVAAAWNRLLGRRATRSPERPQQAGRAAQAPVTTPSADPRQRARR